MLYDEVQVSIAPLRAALTRHRHTEQFSRITYRPILTWRLSQEGEGGGWKNQSTKWYANSKLLQQHFAKNRKQATA